MHPIFGNSDPNAVPQVPPATNNILTPGMPLQNQYNQNYMVPQATVSPYYQSSPQQQQGVGNEMQDPSNNAINYSNFNNFAGAQPQVQQQQQTPQPSVSVAQEIVEKPPLPEEYIYLQTVLEELKTQCINRATNPVS